MSLVKWLDARLYPEHGDRWDDALFRREILASLDETQSVLDLGAGAGRVAEMNFRGVAGRACGVDPDERVLSNPYLDEGRVGEGEELPYADESFDVVFADNVLEHLADPDAVLREVSRVLKPGGRFLAKTPNRRHYVPLIARATPTCFHRFVNRLRGRQHADTFPTRYLINTPESVERHAARAGLVVADVQLIEGRPEYLRLSALTYLCGWLYERTVNRLPFLRRFRVLMIARLEKNR